MSHHRGSRRVGRFGVLDLVVLIGLGAGLLSSHQGRHFLTSIARFVGLM